MFSTKPTIPTTFTLAFLFAIAHIRPDTTAAPPISHFISSIPPDGFIEIPPVSKVTPLPANARGAVVLLSEPFHSIIKTLGGLTEP